jgi:hypothetical protein
MLLFTVGVVTAITADVRRTHGALQASQQDHDSINANIIYIKVPKTASSTTGGIARRIAARNAMSGVGTNDWISNEPGVWANHSTRRKLDPKILALKQKTFIFSMLRDPVDRCLSQFYHIECFRRGVEPSTKNKLQYMNGTDCSNFQLNYISPDDFPWQTAGVDQVSLMASRTYDFLGVDTLYNDSVVLLADMLGMPNEAVLYVPAKVADGEKTKLVVHPPLTEEPKEVQDFAASKIFRRNNVGDYALIDLVTADIKKRYSNEPRLQQRLNDYTSLLTTAWNTCQECCSSSAAPNNCYWNDNGCGYPCLDKIHSR